MWDNANQTLAITGTTTAGIFVATSTTATSTFANGIALSGGCFRDASGECVKKDGKAPTYIVAAQNSTNKAYADYVATSSDAEYIINQAITAAYASGRGGAVYLLEGDYP